MSASSRSQSKRATRPLSNPQRAGRGVQAKQQALKKGSIAARIAVVRSKPLGLL